MATNEELKEEERKLRHLRRMVDLTTALVAQEGDMPVEEASSHIASLKRFALSLFPDKEAVFDLVYGSRLKRLISEKYRLN
jgi:hypothetical protein